MLVPNQFTSQAHLWLQLVDMVLVKNSSAGLFNRFFEIFDCLLNGFIGFVAVTNLTNVLNDQLIERIVLRMRKVLFG
ncbi:hypothetical protein GCM10028773_25780 [Spirosoma koreense]